MKTVNKYIMHCAAGLALSAAMTGCLDETFPNSQAVEPQVATDVEGLTNGMAAYMTSYDASSSADYSDIGFPAIMLRRDAMTADLPPQATGYDYFNYYASQTYLGDYNIQTTMWFRYYYLIQKANLVLGAANADPASHDAPFVGDAYAYRAMAYDELMHSYEYRPSGVGYLDQWATDNGIYGLTVPIVTEKTTEQEAVNNPRVPFTEMYRFIISDLAKAQTYLANTHAAPGGKNHACLGVAYGLAARVWLEMASRFENHPEDLTAQMNAEADPGLAEKYEKLNVSTANDCYAQAARYARLAIAEGFTPLNHAQWFDPKTGFNTPNNSWMWAIIMTTSDPITQLTWKSWVSFICPEATWGVAYPDYGSYRMIDARLYQSIADGDWRRNTWIAPGDAGNLEAYQKKYAEGTSLDFATWSQFTDYAGFKFHPANGDCNTSANGNAVSVPLMRVEEMYFIEAEALARSQGAAAGKSALETFMNAYRMDDGKTYACPGTSYLGVIDEIFNQKRIELWGEGRVYWDYRRMEHAITRGYPGTNHPTAYQFNSYAGFVAPWTTFYIPDSERNLNRACKLNPDPTSAIPAWDGN